MSEPRRFTVDEYHRLVESGILTEEHNVELLDGYLVLRGAHSPAHDSSVHLTSSALGAAKPAEWCIRIQSAITLAESEPEPDVVLARGSARTFARRHPGAADLGLAVEVSDTTLAGDRSDKGRIYARARVPCYWIINLIDRQVEVYTQPSGSGSAASYGRRDDYPAGTSVPLVLDGAKVADIAVQDLLA